MCSAGACPPLSFARRSISVALDTHLLARQRMLYTCNPSCKVPTPTCYPCEGGCTGLVAQLRVLSTSAKKRHCIDGAHCAGLTRSLATAARDQEIEQPYAPSIRLPQ